MKIINKIKAFFRKNDEPVELDLVAAEIREGKAFLHTKGEESLTYMVRANDIEIRLNKDDGQLQNLIFSRRKTSCLCIQADSFSLIDSLESIQFTRLTTNHIIHIPYRVSYNVYLHYSQSAYNYQA